LATARRILESHRGTIAFEFPPAGGTVAIVRLPMTSDFVVDAAAGPE
jgi:hypothetical protein